jgi:pimeloyl-ACP methyl ester carboxylesterase
MMSDRQRIQLGGVSLECAFVGSGPTDLVFLHEGLGSIDLWRSFPEAVAQAVERRAVLYDRRGHGRSDPAVDVRTVSYLHDAAIEELDQVLSALGLEHPILIGHSDGATIALIHATRRPVRGLVLIAPHVYVEAAATTGIERTDRGADALIARLSRYHDRARELYTAWRDIWLDAEFAGWNIEAEITGLSVPILLVQGSDDEYGTLDQLDRIEAAAVGRCERLVIEGAGHSPHLTHLDQVTAAAADFIRTV